MLPQLRAAYAGDRPDLFLYDIAGAPARLLAEQWQIPAVQLSSAFVAWDGYEQELAPVIDAMRADPRGADYYRRFTAWLTAERSSVTDSLAFQGRPRRSSWPCSSRPTRSSPTPAWAAAAKASPAQHR
ncbi:hypothetical protein Acy02nite_48960 [Actinoplanes cyaneus]|uniref:Uncharacterized protein n=1 Tax=Actinoplanes cyaneus TaxID=52696 RepID=A0A919IS20_9ACTN|nr:hypothetical protein [Actinoplanes cyaneus]MCW2143178.1 hypothetical protein [Actinoplanes cyaneus]GID67015.1 hypothetical protein Acy02nite_48960 [Actinoplanes cyaneus]